MAQRAPVLDSSIDELIQTYDRQGPFLIAEQDYIRLALDDPQIKWELHDGLLVEKPGMSFWHGDVSFGLAYAIRSQLDPKRYRLRSNHARLERGDGTYLIPAVMVIPTAILGPEIDRYDVLETYRDPLPFVAEVWSPSTGRYDIDTKLPVYRQRGDLEIWRLQPFEKMVTIWRRQPDGPHEESVVTGGAIRLHALPEVVIDFDALWR